jgi:hypothetical protein
MEKYNTQLQYGMRVLFPVIPKGHFYPAEEVAEFTIGKYWNTDVDPNNYKVRLIPVEQKRYRDETVYSSDLRGMITMGLTTKVTVEFTYKIGSYSGLDYKDYKLFLSPLDIMELDHSKELCDDYEMTCDQERKNVTNVFVYNGWIFCQIKGSDKYYMSHCAIEHEADTIEEMQGIIELQYPLN